MATWGLSQLSCIPSEYTSVQYHTVALAIKKIEGVGKPCFLAKTDIKSAFRIVPVHPSDYELLGFKWREGITTIVACLWGVLAPVVYLRSLAQPFSGWQ